jgi:hypothetical protein
MDLIIKRPPRICYYQAMGIMGHGWSGWRRTVEDEEFDICEFEKCWVLDG